MKEKSRLTKHFFESRYTNKVIDNYKSLIENESSLSNHAGDCNVSKLDSNKENANIHDNLDSLHHPISTTQAYLVQANVTSNINHVFSNENVDPLADKNQNQTRVNLLDKISQGKYNRQLLKDKDFEIKFEKVKYKVALMKEHFNERYGCVLDHRELDDDHRICTSIRYVCKYLLLLKP